MRQIQPIPDEVLLFALTRLAPLRAQLLKLALGKFQRLGGRDWELSRGLQRHRVLHVVRDLRS